MASIDLDRVCVRFPVYGAKRIGTGGWRGMVGGTVGRARGGRPVVTALEDVSLTLRRGDRIGLIGHNGSGKSSLLRVLARACEPTSGRAEIRGRILSLAEPMIGMSAEFTGRENVVLRGIHIALTPRQALSRVDEIAAFSELGAFMDLPLRTYSLGMQLRLAFAIGTAFDPEILLLDEQFLAGDAAFLEKAEARLKAFVARAAIVVQASHSERLIRETCDKAVLLEQGRVAAIGSVDDAFARYRGAPGREASLVA